MKIPEITDLVICWTPELIEKTKREAVGEFRLSNYPPFSWEWE
jgi:hypothetical protein